MKVSMLRKLIRNTKNVFVFEPLTEGYVQVVKSNYLLVLSNLSSDTDLDGDIISLRNSEDLYIN